MHRIFVRFLKLLAPYSLFLLVTFVYLLLYEGHIKLFSRAAEQEETELQISLSNVSYEETDFPKILHQAFSSEMVYSNYKPMIASCLKQNPDWKYYLWRDLDAEALIATRFPSFHARYLQYKHVLQRSDSIRYIVLYLLGGIYLDMDVECVKPFFPSLAGETAFLDQEREEQTHILWQKPFNVMNAVMGSRPRHPFFLEMIRAMLKVDPTGEPVDSTGPLLLTRLYKNWPKQQTGLSRPGVRLLDWRVMSPLLSHRNNFKAWCREYETSTKKAGAASSWREYGCLTLISRNWRMDDSDNSTLAKHRYLNLGYKYAVKDRGSLFNMSQQFGSRINYFLDEHKADSNPI